MIKLNKKKLSAQSGKPYAEIIFLGDVHIGSPQCDKKRFLKQIQYCLDKKVYIFLMGDLVEYATRYSVGAGVYEQVQQPQEQVDEIIEILKPLAKKKLILGTLLGNHEERAYKEVGIDPSKVIADALKIPYLGAAGWNLWKVGSQNYKVYTLHGATGSRFLHTKLSSIINISHSFNAHIIAMGHVHECSDASLLVQDVDLKNKVIKETKKHLIITGHYLSYTGGYGQAKGMPIGKMGSPKVKLFSERFDIHTSF